LRGKTATTCEICGSNFEYYPSAKPGRCVICGATTDELGRNPDIHHIVPVRAFVETPVTAEFDVHYLKTSSRYVRLATEKRSSAASAPNG
jgi:hypothetical protein